MKPTKKSSRYGSVAADKPGGKPGRLDLIIPPLVVKRSRPARLLERALRRFCAGQWVPYKSPDRETEPTKLSCGIQFIITHLGLA
jgi:hypothetical protein